MSVLVLAIAALIFIVVEGVLLYSVWRFRRRAGDPASEPPQVYGSQPIEVAWTAAPAMIVFFLVLVSARTLWEVNPPPPQTPDPQALYVTVIGHQWWWEYVYETYQGRRLGFITANELHIPVSTGPVSAGPVSTGPGRAEDSTRPVYLTLKSADVCHSFWVPRLAGKVDLIPGRPNTLQLESDRPGLYLGQCAEYCGAQHANMLLRVVVEPAADFEAWLAAQAKPAVDDPAEQTGRRTLLAQSCVNCHRIRGTSAAGSYAPDLTHLMSRETLAAGMLPNTPENLKSWVHDPQAIKPGCLMPAFGLSPTDEDAIVAYLLSLR